MPRLHRFAAAVLVTFVAACADVPTENLPTASMHSGRFGSVTPGACTSLSALNSLAKALFVSGQPSAHSVIGKLKNMDQLLKRGRIADAQAKAHEIVDFTLRKNEQNALGGTDAQLEAFINAVYCYVGIDVVIEEPDNTFLVMPSDVPQVLTDTSGTGGIAFDANPVFEPTLIEFELLAEDFPPGGGPLDTKLDQYPGFLQITATSETNAGLSKPAVVGVCATGAIPQEVRDRLRLGHGKATGFEIAAPGNADFLTCENATEVAAAEPLWRKIASLVAPKALQASTVRLSGGGVGGTVIEFSPFAPVDPELSFSGGVGGTVIEFIRESAPSSGLDAGGSFIVDCSTAIGFTEVTPECRPMITVRTNLGTVLSGVPVSWAVTSPGGSKIAARTSFCGAYAVTAATTTNALGQAAICWRMGALGINSVKATPTAGGDAPAGVTFVPGETSFTMRAVAGAPAVMMIMSGDGQSGAFGTTLANPVVVRVKDAYGNPVANVPVTWTVTAGGGVVTPLALVTNHDGKVSATWQLGTEASNSVKAAVNGTLFVVATATGIPD
jgi:hypothetical protein